MQLLEPAKEHVHITPKPVVMRHSGDLGDIVAALPVLRQLGGGTLILSPHPFRNGGPREPMTRTRADFILPLLRAQSYVTEAMFQEQPEGITHDYADLRITTYKRDDRDSLSDWAARHAGIPEGALDTSPWLKADPIADYAGKVIVNKTKRYQNTQFPWMRILQRNKGQVVFIGTRDEHHGLLTAAGGGLRWAKTETAMDMAKVIASGRVFVGNQSFALWLALGLGVPCVASCWQASPDVRIPRKNVQYIFGPKQNPEFFKQLI
jgi:hypothetical protein